MAYLEKAHGPAHHFLSTFTISVKSRVLTSDSFELFASLIQIIFGIMNCLVYTHVF